MNAWQTTKKYRYNGELQALLLMLENVGIDLDKSTRSFREANDRLERNLKGFYFDEKAHAERMARILKEK